MKDVIHNWIRPVLHFKKFRGSRRKRKKERQRLLKKTENVYILEMRWINEQK